MARKKLTYAELQEMAVSYGVAENAMFRTASERYVQQVEMIDRLQKQIDSDGLMVTHVNVKGTESQDPHPLLVQIPKFTDGANKTLAMMLDIIQRLGHEPEVDTSNRFGDLSE